MTFSLLGVGAYLSQRELANTLRTDAQNFLRTKLHDLAFMMELHEEDRDYLQSEVDWQLPILQQGRVYARIRSLDGTRQDAKTQIQTRGFSEDFLKPSPGFMTASRGVQSKSGKLYQIEIALEQNHAHETLARHRTFLQILLAIGFFAVLIISFLIARAIVGPIQTLSRATAALKDVHAGAIPSGPYPQELHVLVDSLNRLHEQVGDQMKSLASFAENLAHEMRNPINVLLGEAEITLSKERRPQEYQETLTSAVDEYRELSQLIDSLLFIARSEAKPQGLNHSGPQVYFSPKKLLQEVLDFYDPLIEERKIQVRNQIPEDAKLSGDPLLIKRAVSNLIENALHYAGKQFSLELGLDRLNAREWVLKVKDDGVGVASEHLPFLFDRFYRVVPESRSTSRESGRGSGLGLAIVKSIMTQHGGRVEVLSQLGQGTELRLIFSVLDESASARIR